MLKHVRRFNLDQTKLVDDDEIAKQKDSSCQICVTSI